MLTEELINLIGVHIVAIDGFSVVVAGQILHLLIFDSAGLAESACPLPMRELTALGPTNPSVAVVWAFESMAVGAVGPLFAVAIYPEGPANRRTWRHFHVSIPAVGLGAVIFGKVQARWGSLRGQIMRQVAGLAHDAIALLKKVLADSNLVWIVHVSTSRAEQAGTYPSVSTRSQTYRIPVSMDVVSGLLRKKKLPVMENILHGASTFLTAPDSLDCVGVSD